MAARPRRPNANTNPAKVVIDAKQKRRSTAQILAEKAQEEADAALLLDEITATHSAKVQRTANFEDTLRQEDQQYQKHAARPDLHSRQVIKPKKVPIVSGLFYYSISIENL